MKLEMKKEENEEEEENTRIWRGQNGKRRQRIERISSPAKK
jgi:hypothetical protein